MPVPQGQITSSEGWNTPQPQNVEEQEEQEDLAAYDSAVADPDPGVPLEEIDWKEE
jgi:hypothetical protein